ncbi:hypothetical protein HYH02_008154 [Chlamydomonas schloesseri]|uniref:Uncharacterized protein n=1 Tax=Chlamydomonas schloesseri TaxID=2026947 RepID=A0A835WHB6_9CHLO|nr:hypothetical protein HYH02_008154 [Chlamydomonas schloesseri]|eukprot:KAG2447000.1 hypothetical protein HYH02_008154 [Chlamydomonas schloesseri]
MVPVAPPRFDSSDSGGYSVRDPLIACQPWPGLDFVAHWGRPEPWRALNRRDRHRLLCLAASSLHAPSLDAALAHCGTVIKADALASAAAAGDLAACERLLLAEGCCWDGGLVWCAAAGHGHVHICRWLADDLQLHSDNDMHQAASHYTTVAPWAACSGGQPEVLRWACTELQCRSAARGGGGAARRPNAYDFARMANAAGEGGQAQLLEGEVGEGVTQAVHFPGALGAVAYGCPLEVLQAYYPLWGPERWEEPAGLQAQGCTQRLAVLLRAVASPTPDWEAKCGWLLGRWGPPQTWAPPPTPAPGPQEVPWLLSIIRYPAKLLDRQLFGVMMRRPDCMARLRYWVAAAAQAVQLAEGPPAQPAQVQAHAAVQAVEAQDQELQQDQEPEPEQEPEPVQSTMQRMGQVAAAAGQVPVLRLLRQRGLPYSAALLAAAVPPVRDSCFEEPAEPWHGGLPVIRHLAGEADAALIEGEVDWAAVFRGVAAYGSDLPLLRRLHEQLGAAIDLAALARGGSEEQMEWAVATLEAAGPPAVQPLAVNEFELVLAEGNWAAADWLCRRGRAPTQPAQLQTLFYSLAVQHNTSQLLFALKWITDRPEFCWNEACRRALVDEMPVVAEDELAYYTPPGQERWRAAMEAAADAALGPRPAAAHGYAHR